MQKNCHWTCGWLDQFIQGLADEAEKVSGVRKNTLESHHQPHSGQWHSRELRGREERTSMWKGKEETAKGQRQMSKKPYL